VCGFEAVLVYPEQDAQLEITELCTEETFLVHSSKPEPIDIPKATALLRDRYPLIAQSAMGVQIQFDKRIEVSVVGEGNILVKGVKTSKEAEEIYHQILTVVQEAQR
jgi:hypothetical protein